MKCRLTICVLAVLLIFAHSCKKEKYAKKEPKETTVTKEKTMDTAKAQKYAVIETKFGNMKIEFFPDKAPGHVKNFIDLANKGFYKLE